MEASSTKNLMALKKLIAKGIELGLDLSSVEAKVDEVIESTKDGIIRIVLMGSRNMGKTSSIAGMLGKVEDDMKIDMEESSDELCVYRPDGLKAGYEIVDTPGLFGEETKEKDGVVVKLSDITKQYISRAHILIYFCEATNPLKEAHEDMLRLVLNNFGKLDSAIFVINKMDDSCDDLVEDYQEIANIKIASFRNRLKNVLGISSSEAEKLNVICIAADPFRRGIKYWRENKEEYEEISHIGLLKDSVISIAEKSNADDLKAASNLAVIKDSLMDIGKVVSAECVKTDKPLQEHLKEIAEMKEECESLKHDILESKSKLKEDLQSYNDSLIMEINSIATLQDLVSFINLKLGIEENEVTGYIFINKINSLIEKYCERNNGSISKLSVEFQNRFDSQEKFLEGQAKNLVKGIGGIKINPEMIKHLRDVLKPGLKFKPWGAVKLADKWTKVLGKISAVLTVLLEGLNIYKRWKDAKKLDKTKADLLKAINESFANIYDSFASEDQYFQNYAPAYLELVACIEQRQEVFRNLQLRNNALNEYVITLETWFGVRLRVETHSHSRL